MKKGTQRSRQVRSVATADVYKGEVQYMGILPGDMERSGGGWEREEWKKRRERERKHRKREKKSTTQFLELSDSDIPLSEEEKEKKKPSKKKRKTIRHVRGMKV